MTSITCRLTTPCAFTLALLLSGTASGQALQSWMSPEVGTAWSTGYKGQGTTITVDAIAGLSPTTTGRIMVTAKHTPAAPVRLTAGTRRPPDLAILQQAAGVRSRSTLPILVEYLRESRPGGRTQRLGQIASWVCTQIRRVVSRWGRATCR